MNRRWFRDMTKNTNGRQKNMKRAIASLMCASMILSLAACGVSTDTGDQSSSTESSSAADTQTTADTGDKEFSGDSIEIAVRYSGSTLDTFTSLTKQFEEETGCKVEVTSYGSADYESSMKTRMASNTLPDLFETHGWSILRYKEYLTDLSQEEWASDYDESALGVIQDDDGSIYVLMTSMIGCAICANVDVCEDSGVDIYSIKTWDDFEEACEKIKAAGYVPIGECSSAGNIANPAGTWVSYDGELAQDSDAMLDGTYDFQSMVPWLEVQAEWMDKGYFAEDYATIQAEDATKRFANNQSAFWIGNDASFFVGCLELNPDGNYAMVPMFSSKEGGKTFVGVGEGDAFGLWKDSKNTDAAKAFLNFLAKPENNTVLSAATGFISSLKSALDMDNGVATKYMTEMQEKCADDDILYENLWDRKYMPSGMWPVFDQANSTLIADHSEAGIENVRQMLQENYQELYETAHSN